MKKCELCKSVARIYCDSDQASLCWDCDSRVHSENFLVSKHTRNLLCHACQSPTPWTGSGPKLGPTLSVCDKCFKRNSHGNRDLGNGNTNDGDGNEDEGQHDGGGGGGGGDGGGDGGSGSGSGSHGYHDDDDSENQVVPLSLPSSLPCNSSRSEESSNNRDGSCNSSYGFWNSTENARFSYYNGMERAEESKSAQKIRPWKRR